MKILINGSYEGGNCPPFYKVLKDLGHSVKVFDIVFYKEVNYSKLINSDDIILPSYNYLTYNFIKLLRKLKISLWMCPFILEGKKVINNFKPDIILNHQTSSSANLMLRTNFKPQFNFIYGSEIKGKNINNFMFKEAIETATLTFAGTEISKNRIHNIYPHLTSKVIFRTFNFLFIDKFLENEKKRNSLYDRKIMGYKDDDFIIYDNRTLRHMETTLHLLKAVRNLNEDGKNIKIILCKGFSGLDKIVYEAQKIVLNYKMESYISIIDKELSNEEHYRNINISNAISSIIPYDEFGSFIMQGMYFMKYLLLSGLPQYKEIFGENAVYINENNYLNIYKSINYILDRKNKINLDKNYDILFNNYNSKTNVLELLNVIQQYQD